MATHLHKRICLVDRNESFVKWMFIVVPVMMAPDPSCSMVFAVMMLMMVTVLLVAFR